MLLGGIIHFGFMAIFIWRDRMSKSGRSWERRLAGGPDALSVNLVEVLW